MCRAVSGALSAIANANPKQVNAGTTMYQYRTSSVPL